MKSTNLFKNEEFAKRALESYKEMGAEASLEKLDDGSYKVEYETKAGSEIQSAGVTIDDMNMYLRGVYDEMAYRFKYMMGEVDWLHERLSKHFEGHLPKVSGAEQMSRAVDALGLNSEYDIQKKVIFASTKSGKHAEVSGAKLK